nr:radical SAM protein [Dissulfurirhabdus thermomarina]
MRRVPSRHAEALHALCDPGQALAPAWDGPLRAPETREWLLELFGEVYRRRVVEQPLTSPVSVQLVLAEACNLRCTYCYGAYYERRPRRALMPPEVARRAVDFAVALGAKDIGLFGGEPLLNLPAIRAVLDHARAAGHDLAYGMTTNATLVTDDIAAMLAAHGVRVSVSIDGPPEVHDLTRPHPDGRGSFDDVLAGIRRLERHRCLDMLEMTYSRRHPPELKPILAYLAGFTGRLSCTCVEGRQSARFADDIVSGDRLRRYYAEMLDFFFETRARGEDIAIGGINELIEAVTAPTRIRRAYLCSGIMNRIAIGPDGTVYPCPETMQPAYAMGNVMEAPSPAAFEARRREVLDRLRKGNLARKWFANLTDVCAARLAPRRHGGWDLEDETAIGLALEDVLYRIAATGPGLTAA